MEAFNSVFVSNFEEKKKKKCWKCFKFNQNVEKYVGSTCFISASLVLMKTKMDFQFSLKDFQCSLVIIFLSLRDNVIFKPTMKHSKNFFTWVAFGLVIVFLIFFVCNSNMYSRKKPTRILSIVANYWGKKPWSDTNHDKENIKLLGTASTFWERGAETRVEARIRSKSENTR